MDTEEQGHRVGRSLSLSIPWPLLMKSARNCNDILPRRDTTRHDMKGMNFPRFSGHLTCLDGDSRPEVPHAQAKRTVPVH